MGKLKLKSKHRLLCGDSTSEADVARLMDGVKADMCFTDPPYGISYQSNGRTASKKFDVLKGDDCIEGDWIPIACNWLRENTAIYICTRWDVYPQWKALIEQNVKVKNVIVWDKVDWSSGDLTGDYSPRHEFVLFCTKGRHLLRGKRESNVWNFGAPNKQNYLHPTQKKVELPAFAISKSSDNGNICIDFFLGSGSTLIACEQLNRKCYGMEIDPLYCDVIVKRWENLTGEKAVLDG